MNLDAKLAHLTELVPFLNGKSFGTGWLRIGNRDLSIHICLYPIILQVFIHTQWGCCLIAANSND